ncbi:head maturation protease, ClpP-related [Haloimpatiens lingqiaonensis]|uniref:head maturation protease, ClpP-related n=1 Tax=Haloimpatiens lingqiaonensis TaxID=1380675 RepID=UPI001A9B50D4|nr:head maturation protease, ClpP-related [Haloimpatiens lingqiaonensis]
MKIKKFWNWIKNEEGERTLYFDGYIVQDSWFDDDITPKKFKAELMESDGDISVWINSPGGDVFAASQIYNMLKEYKGKVTVKIDGLAASAASVIAMAGDEILMSPVAMLMIHNPSTLIWGEEADMIKAKEMLSEVKESIINAYEVKTNLPRNKISKMMDNETWMSSNKAVELGFADKVLYEEQIENTLINNNFIFDRVTVINTLINKFPKKEDPPLSNGTPYEELSKRLNLIK